MGHFIYILKRVKNMDFNAMKEKINKINIKTGKSKLSILLDMQKCAILYGAGYMDYELFEMYNLNSKQRNTYITRGRNNKLIKKYNNKEYNHFFRNKNEFNNLFSKYICRDYIEVKDLTIENLTDFINKHKVFMLKPNDGGCGKGIEKIYVENYKDINELYNYIKNNHENFEIEELIVQHDKVNNIHPNSINTVRIVTILENDIPNVICAYFRIGNGKYVDNFNSGGMVAPINVETGIVSDKAIDKNKVLYENHPLTNEKIKGFEFPDWDKALNVCKEASKVVPQIRYIGWDIAFTPNGPVIVEGNEFPGHDIYQLPEHTPNKIGMMPLFNKI